MAAWDVLRGGFTSKINALVDAERRHAHLCLTAGQVADCTPADVLTEGIGEGAILLADKGYDSNAIRAKVAKRKVWAYIPPETNCKGTFIFCTRPVSAALCLVVGSWESLRKRDSADANEWQT